MAQYFEDYAKMLDAPVRTGVEVHQVVRLLGRSGFKVVTSAGEFEADNVVAATGPFQKPSFPQIVPETTGLQQIHSSAYKNPQQLPAGGVLVVGAGVSRHANCGRAT